MFGNAYTKVHYDSAIGGNGQYTKVPQGTNAFSLERLYLGYDYFYNKNFSAHVVLAHEETSEASFGATTTNYAYYDILYIKYANMEWNNIFKGSKLSLGLIPTPSFAITEEPFWGYRSIDRTVMDMNGITRSNDFGACLGGKLWKKMNEDGTENASIGYNIMVGNSTGSIPINSGITADFTIWKRYYGDLYLKCLNDKLVFDIFGDGHTYQWSEQLPQGDQRDHVYELTGRIFVGYKTKNFNIGAEYFQQIDANELYIPSSAVATGSPIAPGGDTLQNNVQEGFSVFGAAVVMRDNKTGDPKLTLIARYDMFNPCTTFNNKDPYQVLTVNSQPTELYYPATVQNYWVVGFDYEPIKQIHFMPNLMYESETSPYNNSVNTVLNPPSAGTKSGYDMVVRLTFYYQFFKN